MLLLLVAGELGVEEELLEVLKEVDEFVLELFAELFSEFAGVFGVEFFSKKASSVELIAALIASIHSLISKEHQHEYNF